jgi:hypothetical protein
MAALDTEYAHASRRKDLERMGEITAAAEVLRRLWDSTPPPPEPTPPPPPPVVVRPVVVEPPEPLPIPPIAPLLPMVPTGEYSIQELIMRADPRPTAYDQSDSDRREAARRRLKDAVATVSSGPDDQMRYDLALQAINRNVTAMEMFTAEAAVLGITVAELAERVIGERRARERRMMQAHAILARVSAEIDQAIGDAIDVAAEAGIREIEGIQ